MRTQTSADSVKNASDLSKERSRMYVSCIWMRVTLNSWRSYKGQVDVQRRVYGKENLCEIWLGSWQIPIWVDKHENNEAFIYDSAL